MNFKKFFKYEKNKLIITCIGLSICFFILYILHQYNKTKEGFLTLEPVTYSDTTITDYNNYIAKINKEQQDAKKQIYGFTSVETLQEMGVPEIDVQNFVKTGLWNWSPDFTDTVKQMFLNEPNYDPTTLTQSITDAQKTLPQQYYIKFFGTFYSYNLTIKAKAKNLACKMDSSKKTSIGDSLYTIDSSGNITDTAVENSQLPTLIPGFTFLKEVCNPCDLINGKYDCPFALPDDTNKPLFPGFILNYAWDTGDSNTATSTDSINSLSTSLSHFL